jgi:hypothetical protein
MDYLRTLGSAAVSTLVQKSGLNLPFNLGQKVFAFDGICTLYDGTKRVCLLSMWHSILQDTCLGRRKSCFNL